jgi:hypothetical protein
MPLLDDQGFVTIAQNTPHTDYLRLAMLQAMSIKIVMPGAKYAVLVDTATYAAITSQHLQVFDHVICMPEDHAVTQDWKLANEWQTLALTPFRETIKLESDILFTTSVSHWWPALRLRNVVLSTGCWDYLNRKATSCRYREVFRDNHLPDVYSGIHYMRYSAEAYEFYRLVKQCWQQWPQIAATLKNCKHLEPTTDLVFAVAAQIFGVERCTVPTCDFIAFVHMKNAINGWPEALPWCDMVHSEITAPHVRINGILQTRPLHYQVKDWISSAMEKEITHKWTQQNKNLLQH